MEVQLSSTPRNSYESGFVTATMMSEPEVLIGAGGGVYMETRQSVNDFISFDPIWGWEKLLEHHTLSIGQQPFTTQELKCGENQYNYDVFPASIEGKLSTRPIFTAENLSDCCPRICLTADCRPIAISVYNMHYQPEKREKLDFLKIEKGYTFPFLCCSRPRTSVTNLENGANVTLGIISKPFLYCEKGLEVYDPNSTKLYEVRGTCWQKGLLCGCCPIESCHSAQFKITNPSGEIVGGLEKKKEQNAKGDVFSLHFPKYSSKEEKALLVAATFLLDFNFFYRSPSKAPAVQTKRMASIHASEA